MGWSHGKEALKSGQYDTMKGSYYATVLSSHLTNVLSTTQSEPELEYPNIWPDILGFQETFEELCTMIIDIALLVAKGCDRFASSITDEYKSGTLERIIQESTTIRARLLHYFPPSTDEVHKVEEDDAWCAVHVDDGCLTGLTSALFVDESVAPPSHATSPVESIKTFPESPDPCSGLYIRSRTSEVVQINIPPDCLAFQTGSALELMTGGALKAVPHFVKGPCKGIGKVARNTLAVFTQPNLAEIIDGRTGMTFGEHIKSFDKKYA